MDIGEMVEIKMGNGKIVSAELVRENSKTIWVKLPDGHTVKKHKRDIQE
jgi:hypothetical protein